MRGIRLMLVSFLLLTIIVAPFPAVRAVQSPYWLKPGAVIGYHVNSTSHQGWEGGVLYSRGNCTYNIGFQLANVTFEVVNVSGGYALMHVTVLFLGGSGGGVFSNVDVVYPASCRPIPGPLLNTTPFSPNGVRMKDSLYRNLTVSGYYRISISNGTVYTSNGTAVGHTFLFGLYPRKKNSLWFNLGGRTLRPDRVRTVNTTYLTYLRKFPGPNVEVRYPMVSMETPSGENASVSSLVTFNPSNDIALGLFGVIPDLEAVGVNVMFAMDNMLKEYNRKLASKGSINPSNLGVYPAPGLMLSKLEVPAEHTASSAPIKKPGTPVYWVVVVVGAGVLAAVVILLGRRKA